MDFFSSGPSKNPTDNPDTQRFADAIAQRFGDPQAMTITPMPDSLQPPPPPSLLPQLPSSQPHPPLSFSSQPPSFLPPPAPSSFPTRNLPTVSSPLVSSSSPTSSSSTTSPANSVPIYPAGLENYISSSKPLVLDIRPNQAYSSARVITAVSLSVPSTLLKRPLFALERLATMLSSPSARAKFSAWKSYDHILVYDADSAHLNETSNINGLLRKFRKEGFVGQLSWILGGYQAVWKEARHLIDTNPPNNDDEDNLEDAQPQSASDSTSSSLAPPTALKPNNSQTPSALRTRRLPLSAFSITSTTATPSSGSSSSLIFPDMQRQHTSTIGKPSNSASNPFYDSIRQNTELSQGIIERIPLRLPSHVLARISDLPFSWLRKIASHAGPSTEEPIVETSQDTSVKETKYSDSTATPSQAGIQQGAEELAMQFYRLELAEQRRLMAVMEYHSNESSIANPTLNAIGSDVSPVTATQYPYSITAGVEKGAKNRYRHIWPFEHARVRLESQFSTETDDYVNASFVQPIGTTKKYIATQGPLDATFVDFWTLCWQQDVHVIVMLTREVEGSMIKCGSYWKEGSYGPLHLKLVSQTGAMSDEFEKDVTGGGGGGGFFTSFSPSKSKDTTSSRPSHSNKTIRRVFELSNSVYPSAGSRRVVQLQYLGWPDMNVPDTPRGLLHLVRDVEAAVIETNQAELGVKTSPSLDSTTSGLNSDTGVHHKLAKDRPVLLHCSAGVGRTGGFIVVDAVLDAVRRELKMKLSGERTSGDEQQNRSSSVEMEDNSARSTQSSSPEMDVDTPAIEAPIPMHWVPNSSIVPDPLSEQRVDEQAEQDKTTTVEKSRNKDNNMRNWARNVEENADSQHRLPNPNKPLATDKLRQSSLSLPETPENRSSFEPDSRQQTPETSLSRNSEKNPSNPRRLHQSLKSSPRLPGEPGLASSSAPKEKSPPQKSNTHPLVSEGASHERSRAFSAPSHSRFDLQPIGGKATTSSIKSPTILTQNPSLSTLPSAPSAALPSESSSGGNLQSLRPASGNELTPWLSNEKLVFSSPSPKPPEPTGREASSSVGSEQEISDNNSRSVSPLSSLPRGLMEAASLPPSSSESRIGGSMSDSSASSKVNAASGVSSNSTGSQVKLKKRLDQAKHIPDWLLGNDYKKPRPLHAVDQKVQDLSSFEEPIWSVLSDMREQRMSLCQSLRQYAFVHAAIIEGALDIVDEERGKLDEGVEKLDEEISNLDAKVTTTAEPLPGATVTTGEKRGASPTELLKEDRQGKVQLNKRPSVKKRREPSMADFTASIHISEPQEVLTEVSSSPDPDPDPILTNTKPS